MVQELRISLCGLRKLSVDRQAAPERTHWRLYWNPEPGLRVNCGEQVIDLNETILLAIPPHTPVEQQVMVPCNSFFVHVDIGREYNQQNRQVYIVRVDAILKMMLEKVIKILALKADNIGEYLSTYCHLVMARLPQDIWQSKIQDHRIRDITEILREHPEKNYSNRELAKKCFICENAFVRLFREQVGMPPQKFLQEQRLRLATQLLQKTDLSLEEIAERCSFCDRNYFTKLFKRRYEIPPASFRKREF